MKLIPFLNFQGQAHDAMAFYAHALGGEVVSETRYRDLPPMDGGDDGGDEGCGGMSPESLDQVAHCQVDAGGAVLMAADGPPLGDGADPAAATTINVDVGDVGEAERVFAALADGGKVLMPLGETPWAHRWGLLLDRYGKPWMVNCMKQG